MNSRCTKARLVLLTTISSQARVSRHPCCQKILHFSPCISHNFLDLCHRRERDHHECRGFVNKATFHLARLTISLLSSSGKGNSIVLLQKRACLPESSLMSLPKSISGFRALKRGVVTAVPQPQRKWLRACSHLLEK